VRQAIRQLGVGSLTVGGDAAGYRLMRHIRELRDELRRLPEPSDVRGLNPFARHWDPNRVYFIAINGTADLKTIQGIGLHEDVRKPGAIVVDIAEIAVAADDLTAAVADAEVVIQIQASRGDRALGKGAYEVHREEAAAELNHLRAADGGLQPRSVVICGVPI